MSNKKAAISFVDIEAFYEREKDELHKLGLKVEELIVNGRNADAIPIYVTKMRVKSLESIYLKTKRKTYNDVSQIGDLIGLRALCLFEQDIGPTFEYIFELFSCPPKTQNKKHDEFDLLEVTLFNWDDKFEDSEFLDRLERVFDKHQFDSEFGEVESVPDGKQREIRFIVRKADQNIAPKSIIYRSLTKGTGYKSIHFVARARNYSFEIQLRTLLQDVWGELEHSLAYKHGFINPLIGSNFQLFARELEAKDKLMSQLRDIRDKDHAFEHINDKKGGPDHWLGYEVTTINSVFNTEALQGIYSNYESIGIQYKKSNPDSDYLGRLRAELENVRQLLSTRRGEPCVQHWLSMEDAFVCFCEGKHNQAREIYSQISSRPPDTSSWAANYRLGEILLADGKIERALESFDRCESILNMDGDATDISDRERYCVNSKLAYVYWHLGLEYIDIALEKIQIAESFFDKYFDKHPEDLTLIGNKIRLLNNLCYYYLESWLDSLACKRDNEAYKKQAFAKQRCEQLEKLLEENPSYATSNFYDTIAWFYFNRYLDGRKHRGSDNRSLYADITKARKLVQHSLNEVSAAVSPIMSDVLRRRHVETILVEFKRLEEAGLIHQEP